MSDGNEAVGLIVELYRAKTELGAELARVKAERDEKQREIAEARVMVAEVYGYCKSDLVKAASGLVCRYKALRTERDAAVTLLEQAKAERNEEQRTWRRLTAERDKALGLAVQAEATLAWMTAERDAAVARLAEVEAELARDVAGE